MRNRFSPRRQDRKAFAGTLLPSEKRLRDLILDAVSENTNDDMREDFLLKEY